MPYRDFPSLTVSRTEINRKKLRDRFGIPESSFSHYSSAADAIKKRQLDEVKEKILDCDELVNRIERNRNELTPLHLAILGANQGMVKILLEKGFDVNAQDNSDRTSLHLSLYRSNNEISELLLEKGADVNLCDCWGRTPLHIFADGDGQAGSRIVMLMKRGANIEARDFWLGYTPLHYATENKNQGAVAVLLAKDADINARTRGRCLTPLHMAVETNNVELAIILLNCGANIEAPDVNHATPLHLASKEGCLDSVRLLLERGADVNARNNYNNTPLMLSIIGGHYPNVEMILKHRPDKDDKRALSVAKDLLKAEPTKPRSHMYDSYAINRVYDVNDHCSEHLHTHKALIDHGFTLHDSNPVDSLSAALERRNYRRAKFFINEGIMPDQIEDNHKFLIQAIEDRREDVVELLVKTGTRVNAIGPGISSGCKENYGCALGTAIGLKLPWIVKNLLSNGADPPSDRCLSGMERLPITEHKDDTNLEMIEVLLNYGAEIDFPNYTNETPLDRALKMDMELDWIYVRILLINGADVNNGNPREIKDYFKSRLIVILNKLQIAGSYISNYNIYLLEKFKMDCLEDPRSYQTYESHFKHEESRAEVSKMKQHELLDGVSLHQIFITEDHRYLSNQSLMDKLELVDFEEYPEYSDLLRGKLKRDKKQNEVLNRARVAFNFLVLVRGIIQREPCRKFPQELAIKVISQLSKFDQRHLILCGEDLKGQLLGNKTKEMRCGQENAVFLCVNDHVTSKIFQS